MNAALYLLNIVFMMQHYSPCLVFNNLPVGIMMSVSYHDHMKLYMVSSEIKKEGRSNCAGMGVGIGVDRGIVEYPLNKKVQEVAIL